MKILLDENLDWRLGRGLPEHVVESVPLIGWAGLKNGDLLRRAENEFQIFITMDGNLPHQQNIQNYKIAIVALRARSNRLADTQPLMPLVQKILAQIRPGTLTIIPD